MTKKTKLFGYKLLFSVKKMWSKILFVTIGFVAVVWFLIRVIPKPSRASYPCQQAAFPIASSFVLWLIALFTIKPFIRKVTVGLHNHSLLTKLVTLVIVCGFGIWSAILYSDILPAKEKEEHILLKYQYTPSQANQPLGIAKGIFPGRVVWSHDPLATNWKGNWKLNDDQYWLDINTDQTRVDAMVLYTIRKLTGKNSPKNAWNAVFRYYNSTIRGLNEGYKKGEIVAIKANFNNTENSVKTDNLSDESPQLILAMIRQLVYEAGVAPENIVVFDIRRFIPPYLLTKVWREFKDVRFLQSKPAKEGQPKNPFYGDYRKIESPIYVKALKYSNGKYDKACNIPQQIYDATYLINMALLKGHSYPFNTMENGDQGQTGVSFCGKNNFGSIEGTWELHSDINPDLEAAKNLYSPIVDLSASPHLGKKTILYILDALYCGRKWRSYPQHFPNPPFNNQVEPYENPNWPASILASFDPVAIDCVGLDIYHSQSYNNVDKNGYSRILIRNHAADYLIEMALADNPPSGTIYIQDNKPVVSLGVFEHWDNDSTRRYSRNLNPKNGKGIELIYNKVIK